MTTSAEAAKHTAEIGKKHILDQQFRVVRQREMVANLERNGHPDVVADARRALTEMEQMLIQMEVDYAEAQERLAQATVDKRNLAKLKKDVPV
jgi:hypothetical protein